MIAVIDYGMSNLGSICGALKFLDAVSKVVSSPHECQNEKIEGYILPGVGSFALAMKNLEKRGFVDFLCKEVQERGIPILGICLGFQVFHNFGTEQGYTKGFGWIDGKVDRLKISRGERVPHTGWNEVHFINSGILFRGMESGELFYFVHSYASDLLTDRKGVSWTPYGENFCSAYEMHPVYGVQFHPEKSQKAGLHLLRNFLDLCCEKD